MIDSISPANFAELCRVTRGWLVYEVLRSITGCLDIDPIWFMSMERRRRATDRRVHAILKAACSSKHLLITRQGEKFKTSSAMRGRLKGCSIATLSSRSWMVLGRSSWGTWILSHTMSFNAVSLFAGNVDSALNSRVSFLCSAVLMNGRRDCVLATRSRLANTTRQTGY